MDNFFNDFSEIFSIDGTGFNYYDYFLEDVEPIAILKNMFYRIFKPEKLMRTPLTIGHLMKVAEKKKWFSP